MSSQTITKKEIPELRWIDTASDLLDSRFRIPGTKMRFGLDFIIGLVPYAGDLLSFLFSGTLILAMVRHGASGMLVGRMLWNVVVDTLVGSIPVLGDLFDLVFKSNRRNYNLLKEHYEEGRHKGSIWPVLIAVLVVLILLFVLLLYVVWLMVSWTFGFISNL